MKKKPAASAGPKCPSTNSGYACAITGDHTVHCNKEKRSGQYLTWETIEDGRIKVTAHQGKNENTWYDEAPEAPPVAAPKKSEQLARVGYCGEEFEGFAKKHACTLPAGHPGIHENTSRGAIEGKCDDSDDEQPEAVDTKPETPGFVYDPAPNPGDTRTVNGKHERWIWEAPVGFGWREYKAKGKGCPGCGRHKVDCLCKQMKATPPAPAPAPVAELEQPSEPLTKIGEYDVHEAAARFDMLEGAAWLSFLEDIRVNGQRDAIVLIIIDGKTLLLDGRNRLRACIELGIEPRFRMFGDNPGDGSDPIAFVASVNIQRRHMDETQRSHVGAGLVPLYEAQAKERQRAAGRAKPVSANLREAVGKASEAAARAVNVSARSVELAMKVQREAAPEVVAASKAGRIKVSTAAGLAGLPKQQQREIIEKLGGGELRSGKVRALVNQEKKRAVVRKINSTGVAAMPEGPFGVIYGDYPWHYDNSDQHEGSRGHLGYPTMTMEQVLAHASDAAKRAGKDCILALWATNLYVVDMKRVLAAYGATQRTVFTWPKPKFGVGTWGRGQTEHLVIASIGEPTHTLNEISTLLQPWKPEHQGEHSSKPAEVAELLRKHCSGPFLELFGRGPREGFVVWGAEAEKFATEAA